jgi:5-methylcytosine-specific restriction endonuclease McrA
MKRKKPIKKTPLARTPLKRGSKPIAQRSKKTEKIYIERRKIVAEMLSDFPMCFACPVFAKHDCVSTFIHRKSVDVHELIRRSQGGSILERDNLVTVCRQCHTRIGNEPSLAFSLGLAKHSWD